MFISVGMYVYEDVFIRKRNRTIAYGITNLKILLFSRPICNMSAGLGHNTTVCWSLFILDVRKGTSLFYTWQVSVIYYILIFCLTFYIIDSWILVKCIFWDINLIIFGNENV